MGETIIKDRLQISSVVPALFVVIALAPRAYTADAAAGESDSGESPLFIAEAIGFKGESLLGAFKHAAAPEASKSAPLQAIAPVQHTAVPGTLAHSGYVLERAQFQAATRAMARNDIETFNSLGQNLSHYPLARYLRYLELRQAMSKAPGKQSVGVLNGFEKAYGDVHLTRKLTRHLQRQLVKAEEWKLFLGVSKSTLAATMSCATARARAETTGLTKWDDDLTDYWVARGSFPALCRDALAALEARKLPGIAPLWEKIYKSINDGRLKAARELAGKLARQDHQRVDAWVDALDKPQGLLQSASIATDDFLNRRRVLDLTRRWSKLDPPAAVAHWQLNREKYAFSDDQRYELDRELGLRGAWLRRAEAYDWLNRFEARDDDLEVLEWRVRSALYAGDWKGVLDSLEGLPPEELEEDHWAYWHARALSEADRDLEAGKVMSQVAKLPTYYGFLAADRLGLAYNIVDRLETDVDPVLLEMLATAPELIRAREYLHAGLPWEGRREWNRFIGDLPADSAHRISVAELARRWQLPDRAIASANLAGEKKALSLRFPFAFGHLVDEQASQNRLDPEFVFAIIRRESAYMEDIQSSAGARGLMQLMPATAKDAARMLGRTPNSAGYRSSRWISLVNPADNIALGTRYLRHIMDRFDDHLALTAASYNAGPHRTLAWLPEDVSVPADQWIDTIPFSETRRYVRAILAYMTIFEWRQRELAAVGGLDRPVLTRLSERLLPIPAKTPVTSADKTTGGGEIGPGTRLTPAESSHDAVAEVVVNAG